MSPPVEWELKCWGRVMHIFQFPTAGVSYLEVEEGWQCSKHFHQSRANHFAVISGKLLVEEWGSWKTDPLGDPIFEYILSPGDTHFVSVNVWHRFRVLESGVVVEYYNPTEGAEVHRDDIVRYDIGGKIE